MLHDVLHTGVLRLLLWRGARVWWSEGDEVGISRQEQKRDLEKDWCSDSGHGGGEQKLVMLR